MFDREQLQRLFQYGYSLTNSEADAYDLLQDAIERFLQTRQNPNNLDKPEHYLRKIMRNRYIDQLRHARRYPLEPISDTWHLDPDQECHDIESLVIAEDMVKLVWSDMTVLERELLFLWAVEGYTAQEIADQTDSPRGTVLARIHRLRKKVAHRVDGVVTRPAGETG